MLTTHCCYERCIDAYGSFCAQLHKVIRSCPRYFLRKIRHAACQRIPIIRYSSGTQTGRSGHLMSSEILPGVPRRHMEFAAFPTVLLSCVLEMRIRQIHLKQWVNIRPFSKSKSRMSRPRYLGFSLLGNTIDTPRCHEARFTWIKYTYIYARRKYHFLLYVL